MPRKKRRGRRSSLSQEEQRDRDRHREQQRQETRRRQEQNREQHREATALRMEQLRQRQKQCEQQEQNREATAVRMEQLRQRRNEEMAPIAAETEAVQAKQRGDCLADEAAAAETDRGDLWLSKFDQQKKHCPTWQASSSHALTRAFTRKRPSPVDAKRHIYAAGD